MAATDVREAGASDYPALARALAAAFADDPVTLYLMPESWRRERHLVWFYELVLARMAPVGRVLTRDDLPGAAIWRAPGAREPAGFANVPFLMRMLRILGRQVGRGRVLGELLERVHIREPHWYLAVLGTHPERQGEGHGSAHIKPVLEQCDAEGVPAYLESSKEANLPFYERYGFEVTEVVDVPDGPRLYAMLRPPR